MRSQTQKERDYFHFLKTMTLKALGEKAPPDNLEKIINQQVSRAVQLIGKVQHQEIIEQISEAVKKMSDSENGGSNVVY